MTDWVSHSKRRDDRDSGPDWEITFYEDILKRHPDYVEVLSVLGSLYTSNRMYAAGLKVDQRLASLRKDDPVVHYNLACSYALLRQAGRAFEALRKAIGLGYNDVKHMEKDKDLESIRSDPRYARIVAGMSAASSSS